MGIKVMHLADIHLGMENYGRIDPKTGLNSRLLDFLDSFDQTLEYALARDIDLVVFAGDAFKTRDPNPTQQREFAARIKRLSAAGIPTVLLVGNHDLPNSDGKAHSLEIYRTLAVDNVFVARRPEVFRIGTKKGPAQVACLPYLTRSSLLAKEDFKGLSIEELDRKMAGLLAMFIQKLAGDLDKSIPSILAAHISVANSVLSSVALPDFDYVALGHIHRHQALAERPPVVYAGSLDRIDFGEEKEEKGFCVVDLVKGAATFEFKPVKSRPFLTIDIAPREADPTEEVLSALAIYELSGAVVRLNLTLSQEQAALVRMDEIFRFLSRESYYLAGINKQVSGPATGVRSPGLTEQVGPIDALEVYLRLQPELEEQAPLLMELARGLVAELQEEDNAS